MNDHGNTRAPTVMSDLPDGVRRRTQIGRQRDDKLIIDDRASEKIRTTRLPFGVAVLIWGMVTPLIFDIGGLRLTPNRLVLIVFVLPCLAVLLNGRAGRIRFPDIGLILLWAWSVIAVAANRGVASQIEQNGIFFLETVGAYLIGRVYVRDADCFAAVTRLLFFTVILMLPFAIVEAVSGKNLILYFFNAIGHSYVDNVMEPRLGFNRAQGALQHPILFGVYCGAVIALSYFVLGYRRSGMAKSWRMLVTLFTAMTCLSSGPQAAMVAQVGIIVWDALLHNVRQRWWILTGLAIFAWILVDLLSNRTPPEVFISYFALNPATAYNRILIWEYGSASVLNHPLVGIGPVGEWERPSWMNSSMDMYWLVVPVRYGIPAGLLSILVFLHIFLSVALRSGLDDRHNAYRLGFLGCMLGFFMVGWTVHFWNETYVLFMFLMGAGMWILDVEKDPTRDLRWPRNRVRTDARAKSGRSTGHL